MKTLEYPFTAEKVGGLKVGETVCLSGRIVTARDCVHKYLFEGGKSPVDLKEGAVYHCGPLVAGGEGKWSVRAAGPTTSMRLEPYTERLIEQCGIRVIIGKGGMGEATRRACVAHGCAYLQVIGGAASKYAQGIERVESVHFLNEFGPAEAMWELMVNELEAVVTIDTAGRSLHRRVKNASRRVLNQLLKKGN